jgi:CPA2 family monovalent cation:H+ antiporter-2
MHEFALLRDLLILIAIAIPAVAIAQRINVPTIVAFLITGILIGPSGLGLIGRSDDVVLLAEIGVVLLLFEIGLEVSLSQVIESRTTILLGGITQVGLTLAATTGVAVVTGMPAAQAVVFGCLIAVSSTAIVLKSYQDRGELDTPQGRISLAVLLFQDLMIVPMIVLIQVLGSGSGAGEWTDALRPVIGLGVLIVLVPVGLRLVPAVLGRIPDLRNSELFTLMIGFFGLGTAFLTASLGLSLAVGAFIAGLIISESEYGAQAISDVLPFRALFSSIFFTSVGMLLDLGFVMEHLPVVAGVTAAVIVGKAALMVGIVTAVLKRPLFNAVLTGVSMAQVGEFAFVLASVALGAGLLTDGTYQVFLAAAVFSMLATPFLIEGARPLAEGIVRLAGGGVRETDDDEAVSDLQDHAIIVGFGMSGHHLARVLKAAHLKYIVLETNGLAARAARQEGESILFGDGTRPEVLIKAGIRRARVFVMNISSPVDERRGIALARQLNPDVKILVRTRAVNAIADLEARGADDVVVEEYEAALELFQRVLRHYRIPMNTIATEMDAVRAEHYGLLRGVPKHILRLDQLRFLGIHHALELFEVEPGSRADGESPVSLRLRAETGATVVAVVREGQAYYNMDADSKFQAGDTVVVVGASPTLVKARDVFCQSGDDNA